MPLPTKLHFYERVTEAAAERFWQQAAVLVTAFTVEGRPIFTVPLSPAERFARLSDPQLRAQILAEVEARDGPGAAHRVLADIPKLAKRLTRGGRSSAG